MSALHVGEVPGADGHPPGPPGQAEGLDLRVALRERLLQHDHREDGRPRGDIARPDATREEVEEAAKKARCYDFIMQLPDGFDTVIGEGGASLSGGEKQRISIARCILKDAPIVILDEATASVDADNERAIQEAISELCRNKTLLVIAHRLKTIRDADQILVIADGQIAEQGNHAALMDRQGSYAHMVTLQAS